MQLVKSLFQKGHDLPDVRIKEAELKNFKSVRYGRIEFDCSKQFVPRDTKSDILGIYGQNGSGKTAFIEALSVLRRLMSGGRVPVNYADCISVDADYAELSFVFDLQYNSGEQRDAFYSFKLERIALTKDEINELYEDEDEDDIPDEVFRVHVFDEILKLSWNDADGIRKNKQRIFDASLESVAFGPADKRKEILGGDRKAAKDLIKAKGAVEQNSQSFIFSDRTLNRIKECGTYSLYFQVMLELQYFAKYYFFVIDTKSSGYIRLNVMLPIYTARGRLMFDVRTPGRLYETEYDSVMEEIKHISDVLSQLVPGLSIYLKPMDQFLDKDGDLFTQVTLMAKRGDTEMPLKYESDGIRKLISELSLIISAYTNPSVTVAIDEFDAGIFEYLLGEILQIIEDSGKGQFIFTSHNLRPLEVIDKKFLYFTTTNPDNRYVHLKGIGTTNNLRNTYFREIIMGENSEEIYNSTKRYKIVATLKRIAKADKERLERWKAEARKESGE